MRIPHLLFPLALLILCSCSPQGESEKQDSLEEAAEQRGHEAARQIKAPIEKAGLATQIQENRDRKLREALDQE